jgi:hypothetical protein
MVSTTATLPQVRDDEIPSAPLLATPSLAELFFTSQCREEAKK